MIKTYLYIALTIGTVSHSIPALAQQQKQQQSISIQGKVLHEDQTAQQNVAVQLINSATQAIAHTSLTNAAGEFTFSAIPAGEFYIQATAIGYESGRSAALVGTGKSMTIANIILKPKTQIIEDVTVKGRIAQVQQKDGKLIMNVENSILAAGNSALEIIQRAPGVGIDKDDNLTLMGRQGVKVTIDGRQSYMSGDQLATFLKTLDGNQIKSVEVSTSRSAMEDAEGAVGTINIVLKKNKMEGFTGSVLASITQAKRLKNNASANFSYKKENTTIFGSYGYAYNPREIDLSIQRNVVSNTGTRLFDQNSILSQKNQDHSYKVGIEQKTSTRNTVLLQFKGDNSVERNLLNSTTLIGKPVNSVDSILYSHSNSRSPFNRYSANLNNEFVIDEARKLTFDLDWSAFRNRSNVNYEYRTLFPEGGLVHAPEYENNLLPSNIDVYAARLDYEQTIGKSKLQFGAKYSRVKSDNDVQYAHLINGQWQEYEGRSNHFLYTEQITAGYADFSTSYGKFSTKLGLRAEYSQSDGNSITLNNRVTRNYLDFFPSANVAYNASPNHVLSANYARKITRPNYRYLNPFEWFVDKYTSQRGNAYLNPEYTNSISLNYTLNKIFNFSLGTDITNGAIVESLGQDTQTGQGWVTRDNLGKSRSTYLNANISVRIGKIWSSNNNLTGIHMSFEGPIAGAYLNTSSTFFQGRSTHNFRFSKAFAAEMSANYNSAFSYNIYKLKARWGVDLGINYNFKDERSALKFAATDIFKTQVNRLSTDFNQFNTHIRQYNDNRSIRLTYTYKFGNLKQESKRRNMDSDEKNRAL